MSQLIIDLLLSLALLASTVIIAWLGYFFIARSIKKRGQVVRSVDMELFSILIPRDGTQEELAKPIQDRIEPMEQLYAIFSQIKSGGFWEKWEFGRPHVVWEIVFLDGQIQFFAALPSKYSQKFVQAVHAVFPDAVIEKAEEHDIFKVGDANAASYVVTNKSQVLPIKTFKSLSADPINSIVTTLAKLTQEDGAAIQIIMRPAEKSFSSRARKIAKVMQEGKSLETALHESSSSRIKPIRLKIEKPSGGATPHDQEIINAIQAKANKNLFEVNIRLVATSQIQERADSILNEMEGAFKQFSSPNLNHFSESRESLKKILYEYSFKLFDEKRAVILSTEELASIFHLPLPGSQLPRIKWLKARSAPAPWGMTEGIVLGVNEYRNQQTPVRLAREDRRRHLYTIGQTGTGKTAFIRELIRQDIEAGEGACVIDPHGDLVKSILEIIPKERWNDVVVFDPTDGERPLGLNMLEYDPSKPEQKTFIVDELMQIFNKLYDLKTTGGPIFEQYTRNSLLLLMEFPQAGYTLMEVPRVLADKEFRQSLLEKATNPVVKDFWQKEAEKAGGEAALANLVPYITSKFNVFIANDFMRPVIGQAKSSLNFRSIIDESKILLVSLTKGQLGEANMSLLGLIIVGKLTMASFSRADIEESLRKDFYLYLDEFHNFTTDTIATILSEARKYRLNLTVAHQFIAQLPESISKAVFGNVGNMAMFRIGEEDANLVGQYLEPIFSGRDLINLDNFHCYVRLMLNGQTTPPFNMKTLPPQPGNPETEKVVRNLSRMTHGRDRELAEQEIERRYKALPAEGQVPTSEMPPELNSNL